MPVRVLVVGPVPPPVHGVAAFTRDLLEHGRDPRFELVHLNTSDPRDASNIGKWDPTNIQLGFANLAEMAGKSLKSDIGIVYLPISQNVPAFLRDALFVLQSRMLGKKVVLHLHGAHFRDFYEREAGAAFRPLVRAVLNATAGMIVLAEEFRPLMAGLMPDERVFAVENGVPDSGAWKLRQTPTKEAESTVLYMSTLTRTKGILELLQAAAQLKPKRPALRLKVAGAWDDPALKAEALALVEREKLGETVAFVGNVSGAAKADFLAGGDLFCLPTRYVYEGQPLAILEAMAAGLPVLASNHGAIGSTLGDAGRLIPKNASPEILATELERMLADEGELRALGIRARARYLERYTLEACHLRLFEVFARIR